MASETGTPSSVGMTREQQDLAVDNLALVPFFLNKMGMNRIESEWDDLVQAGRIGLMKAAVKYEPERGNTFATYAAAWIRNAIRREADKLRSPGNTHLDFLRRRLQQVTQADLEGRLMRHPTRDEVAEVAGEQVADLELPQVVSIEAHVSHEGTPFTDHGSWLSVEDSDLYDDLEQLDYLDPGDKALLIAHGMGYTQVEIAASMGVIPHTVGVWLRGLKARLVEEL